MQRSETNDKELYFEVKTQVSDIVLVKCFRTQWTVLQKSYYWLWKVTQVINTRTYEFANEWGKITKCSTRK